MNGFLSSAAEFRSRRPPPKIHQPSAAEPSPPTFSLPTNDEALHVDGMNKYFACSLSPFSAASMRIWVQVTPAVMPINTSGAPAASVVIGSLTVGADGSIVSVADANFSLLGD